MPNLTLNYEVCIGAYAQHMCKHLGLKACFNLTLLEFHVLGKSSICRDSYDKMIDPFFCRQQKDQPSNKSIKPQAVRRQRDEQVLINNLALGGLPLYCPTSCLMP